MNKNKNYIRKYLIASNLKTLATVASILFISSCAGSPMRVSMMSSEELKSQNEYTLCLALAYSNKETIKNELLSRKIFTDKEWDLIDNKKISIGMSELSLNCSWGRPMGGINKSVGSWGTHKQYVYDNGLSRKYVYVDNGKVTSWQN